MSKNILLVENRAKQMIVMSLNLNVYLDSEVHLIKSLTEFEEFLKIDDLNIDLIISRDNFNDSNISEEIDRVLGEQSLEIPHLVIGSGEGQILLDDKLVIRPLLKESASILNLTPQMMAEKNFGELFELPSSLIHFVNYAPCDIFISENGLHFDQVYNRREPVNHEVKVNFKFDSAMYVRTNERLEFVNSLTEQNRDSFLEPESVNERFQKEVDKINGDMDSVSNIMVSGADTEEVAAIAKKSVQSMMAMAEEDIVVKDLISRLSDSDANFRFKHSQLIIFIGLQVLKALGKSAEDMESFSQAAFFHDICLRDDEMAAIRCNKSLLSEDFTMNELDEIRNHAQEAEKLAKRLNTVDEKALRIIAEHHGSKEGLGFNNSLKGLSYLSKAFVITEHWVHIQMFASEEELKDLNSIKNLFLRIYPGTSEGEFIKALFILESRELVSSVTDDITQELINIKGAYELDESITLVKGIKGEDEHVEKVSGVTDNITEESQVVKGDGPDGPEEAQLIKGSGPEEKDDTVTTIKGSQEDLKEENYIVKGEGAKEPKETKQIVTETLGGEESKDKTPKVNGEMLISAYISKSNELKEEIGGDWAFSKFLSTLMALDNPLASHPFVDKFNEIWLELKETTENGGELDTFKSQIKSLMGDIQEKFEADIVNMVNNRDKLGRTKIMIAIASTNIEIFNYILGFSPDLKLVDTTGKTALHYACLSGNIDIVEKVLAANSGALNKADGKKRTALFLAVNSNNEEMVELLIDAGAMPKMVADNAISTCMMAAHHGNIKILEMLEKNGESIFAVDKKYKTCMHYAKQKRHAEVVQYLKKKGLDQ